MAKFISEIDTSKMDRSEIIKERFFECLHKNEVKNSDMVEIFKRISEILNLKTVSSYALAHGITYQAVHKSKREDVIVDGKRFVIDNE